MLIVQNGLMPLIKSEYFGALTAPIATGVFKKQNRITIEDEATFGAKACGLV